MTKVRAFALLILIALGAGVHASPQPVKRPMEVVKDLRLGLEVWIERSPSWHWEIADNREQVMLIVDTPAAYYPPSRFLYLHFPGLKIDSSSGSDFKQLATGVLEVASNRFGLSSDGGSSPFQLSAASYGLLNGFETVLPITADEQDLDLKIFIGQGKNGGPACVCCRCG